MRPRVVLLACAFLFAPKIAASSEFAIKAAFIYQFTNYIDWPERRLAQEAPMEPFVVTLLGDSPLLLELQTLAKAKTIKGRPISVQLASQVSQIGKSHIVIVANANAEDLSDALKKTKDTHTLIISQADGFARRGAMINFFEEGGRLRFEVNRAALENEKLRVSSQLLKLARLVE